MEQLRLSPYKQLMPNEISDIQKHMQTITRLDMSHKKLNKSIKNLNSLPINIKTLNVEFNSLKDVHLEKVIILKHLSHLNISNNPINTNGLKMLINLTKLQYLNLNNTSLDSDSVQIVSYAFPSLKSLQMGFNNLGPNSEYLSLAELQLLKSLSLPQNKMTDEGVKKLQPLLGLKHLNLRSNELTVESVSTLSKFTKLQNLFLGYNYFQEQALVKLFQNLPLLKQLNLSYNLVSNSTIMSVARHCPKITKVDLRCNKCSLEGFLELVINLKELQYLCVNQNQIGIPDDEEQIRKFIDVIGVSKLQTLDIQNNRLHKKQRLRMLKQLFQSNKNLKIRASF